MSIFYLAEVRPFFSDAELQQTFPYLSSRWLK